MRLTALNEEHRFALASGPLFAVFDRDGTLVPISSDPFNAPVQAVTRRLLNKLALCQDTKVAILSARSCTQLKIDFTDERIILAGNYGLEITAPGSRSFMHPVALACRDKIADVKSRLLQDLTPDTKIIIEDHNLSLCLHYHLATATDRQQLLSICNDLKAGYPELRFRQMPTSTEVLPSVQWDKAKAMDCLKRIIQEPVHTEANRRKLTYFFGGDSAADEPAFRWVNTKNGITVMVGADKASSARYAVESPSALFQLIDDIIGARMRN